MPNRYSELIDGILKVAPIVFLAVGSKIAIQIKNKKATIVGSFISLFIGLAVTYIVSPYIESVLSKNLYIIALGSIAILSDKIIEFMVFQMDIGKYAQSFLDILFEKLKNFFK